MDGSHPVVYRSTGQFLRIRGTERVIHYNRFFAHQMQSDADIWELCGLRLMRQALADARRAGTGELDVVGVDQTLSMLCGAAMREALAAAPPGGSLLLGNASIAMELEALKLLRRPDGRPPTPVDVVLAASAPAETADLVRFLHADTEPEGTHPLRSIAPGPLDLDRVPVDTALVVLNHARQDIGAGPDAARAAAALHARTGIPVLALYRATGVGPLATVAVDGTPVALEGHYAFIQDLAGRGLTGAHAFVEGFDRDFLLPPNGTAGLGILLLARDAASLRLPGFETFPAAAPGAGRALAPWGGAARHNYALALDWDLPAFAVPADWDWRALAAEGDDAVDPALLAAQPSRAAGALLAGFAETLDTDRLAAFPGAADAIALAIARCERGEMPWNGALTVARLADGHGRADFTWRAVLSALFDLESFGLSAEAAFTRAEKVFGPLLAGLRDPDAGLAVMDATAPSTPYARTQVATIRALCALRLDRPAVLIQAASLLLRDPDWRPAAELMLAHAERRLAGTLPEAPWPDPPSPDVPMTDRTQAVAALIRRSAS